MSFLVVLRPVREQMPFEPTDEEAWIIGEHYAYLQRLRSEGKLVVAGPSIVPGDVIGIGVLDVAEESEACALVDADPAVATGTMTAEIRPMRIAVR